MIEIEVELSCDGAGAAYSCDTPPIFARTAKKAREWAREAGWRVAAPGGRDYCPTHWTHPGAWSR